MSNHTKEAVGDAESVHMPLNENGISEIVEVVVGKGKRPNPSVYGEDCKADVDDVMLVELRLLEKVDVENVVGVNKLEEVDRVEKLELL